MNSERGLALQKEYIDSIRNMLNCLSDLSCSKSPTWDEKALNAVDEGCLDVNADFSDGTYSAPPLLHAAPYESEKLFSGLVDRGADVNIRNRYGVTALFINTAKGNEKFINWFLDHGASPDIRLKTSGMKETDLEKTNLNALAVLKKSDNRREQVPSTADVVRFWRNMDGWTPLFLATELRNGSNVELLLQRKARADLKDAAGRLPIEIAFANRDWLTAAVLMHYHPVKDLTVEGMPLRTFLEKKAPTSEKSVQHILSLLEK